MTPAEKTELGLIPVIGALTCLLAHALPRQITEGTALVWASALMLFQGLLRDLWLLTKAGRSVRAATPRHASCMCVESTVGVTGITAGIVLLGAGNNWAFYLNRWGWCLAVTALLTIGFALKDYVFEWNPFRLRRDKDHLTIVFAWKK